MANLFMNKKIIFYALGIVSFGSLMHIQASESPTGASRARLAAQQTNQARTYMNYDPKTSVYTWRDNGQTVTDLEARANIKSAERYFIRQQQKYQPYALGQATNELLLAIKGK